MELEFADKHLASLYTTGRSKKHSATRQVAKKFVERVNRIQDSVDINDLRVPPSMHFERLEGFASRFSIRVDLTWRLEFEIDFEDEARTTGSVRIVALSKHYE